MFTTTSLGISFFPEFYKCLESITLHIQELNPVLRELVESIRIDTEKISDLENRQTRLTEYISQIENLMAWKNR